MGEIKSSSDACLTKEQVKCFKNIELLEADRYFPIFKELIEAVNILIEDYKDRYNVE